MAAALGVHPARSARDPSRRRPRLGPEPDRRLHPGPARARGAGAVARGRAGHPDPARDARPDRAAADPRRDRRVRARHQPGRLRKGRRSPAGLAALRRADGHPLAQRRPVRRHQRLPDRRRRASCGAGATGSSTPTTATCRSTGSRSSSSPATCCRTPTLDQKIATGFNRNHRGNAEGGIIPEEYAVEYVVDRVDTTATVWLGLTLGCARCHDHKFDPITQKEFYQLFAFFNNVPENGKGDQVRQLAAVDQVADPRQREQLERSRSADGLERQVRQREPRSRRPRQPGSRRCATPAFDWYSKTASGRRGTASTERWARSHRANDVEPHFRDGQPRSVRPSRLGPRTRRPTVTRRRRRRRVRLLRQVHARASGSRPTGPRGGTILSRMVDQPQGEGYSVVLDRGKVQVNLVKRWLDDAIRVETAGTSSPPAWTHVAVTYDGSRLAGGVKVYVDGKLAPLKVLLDELNQTFQTKEPLADRRRRRAARPVCRAPSTSSAIYRRGPRSRGHRGPGDAASRSPRSLAIPPARRTAGQARKLRECFLATEAPDAIRELDAQVGVSAARDRRRSSRAFPRRW